MAPADLENPSNGCRGCSATKFAGPARPRRSLGNKCQEELSGMSWSIRTDQWWNPPVREITFASSPDRPGLAGPRRGVCSRPPVCRFPDGYLSWFAMVMFIAGRRVGQGFDLGTTLMARLSRVTAPSSAGVLSPVLLVWRCEARTRSWRWERSRTADLAVAITSPEFKVVNSTSCRTRRTHRPYVLLVRLMWGCWWTRSLPSPTSSPTRRSATAG